MTNDPRECQHVLACDDATHVVYCTQCMWWWDADFESPRHSRPQCVIGEQREPVTVLNADNEPTSEHMQWRQDNDTEN